MKPIADDQPLTLEHAAEIFLGDRQKVSTLRAEAKRGNLVISKMGRNYWTTLAACKEMRDKCRVEAQAPASGTTSSAKRGQSSTAEPATAQGAALRTLGALKEHFASTSKRGTRELQATRR